MKLPFVLSLLLSSFLVSAQSLSQKNDKVIFAKTKSYSRYDSLYRTIRDQSDKLSKPKGKISFGMNGNAGEKNSLFKINSGINVTKLKFPYELNFTSNYQVVSNNGKLQEDISEFSVSYDHYLTKLSNKHSFEGFAFVDRQSNLQMSVNQRYEIGGGIIWQSWGKKENLIENYKSFSTQNRYSFKSINDTSIIFWLDSTKSTLSDTVYIKKGAKALVKDLNEKQTQIIQGTIRDKTFIRFAFLTGIFYEIEKINFSDSFLTSTGTEYLPGNFDATNRLRWEIRPTIDFTLFEKVDIKLRSYIKLPVPDHRWTTLVDGKEEVDVRIETPLSMSMKLNENFELSLTYTNYFDNAPNSVLSNKVTPDLEPIYITANKLNELVTFQVVFTL